MGGGGGRGGGDGDNISVEIIEIVSSIIEGPLPIKPFIIIFHNLTHTSTVKYIQYFKRKQCTDSILGFAEQVGLLMLRVSNDL